MSTKLGLDLQLVEEFVSKAHGDMERVKALLNQEPTLVNAAWDWGGGDFETALGAAAHMGRRDIANFLLDHGARIDIFAATMLGKLEIVKTILDSFPETKYILGPHRIPLLAHAEADGLESQAVLNYLKSLE